MRKTFSRLWHHLKVVRFRLFLRFIPIRRRIFDSCLNVRYEIPRAVRAKVRAMRHAVAMRQYRRAR